MAFKILQFSAVLELSLLKILHELYYQKFFNNQDLLGSYLKKKGIPLIALFTCMQ